MSAELRAETGEAADGRPVVVLSGEVDLSNVDQLRAALGAGVVPARPLVADLNGLTYLDSAGVAALFERARAGDLEVVADGACVVAPVLRLTRLADVAVVRGA